MDVGQSYDVSAAVAACRLQLAISSVPNDGKIREALDDQSFPEAQLVPPRESFVRKTQTAVLVTFCDISKRF